MTTPALPPVSPGISEERLAEIEALVDAATEGPWSLSLDDPMMNGRYKATIRRADENGDDLAGIWIYLTALPADASFIAASRTAVPELLAEVRRLRQQVEANEAKDALLAVAAAQFDAIRALGSSHGWPTT